MGRVLQINFDFANPEIRIPGADFWSCNGLHVLSEPAGLKATGWFQIHRPEDLPKERQKHLDWLYSAHDFPVWVNPRTAEKMKSPRPNLQPLPMEDLNALWTWPFPVAYSCTFSYQLAMAILLDYSVVDMSDVRLADRREKALEAPNVLLWAGEAHKRGIEVLLSDEYTYPFRYGQVERLTDIPYWVERDVVNDMFPGWSRETRKLFHKWMAEHEGWKAQRGADLERTRRNISEGKAPMDNS